MQSDPIGYGDGMNFFNYAHSDPVNGSDPSGLSDACSIIPGGQSFSEDGNTATVGDATLCYQTPDPPDPGTELDLPPSLTFGTGFPGLRGLNKTPHSLSLPQGGPAKANNSCNNLSSFARGLDAFATHTQRAAGSVAVASLVPQAFGGPIDPVADVFTGAGEALAGVLEISALSASTVSAGIQLFQGNGVPAAATAIAAGLSAASGLPFPAITIANTIGGELASAAIGEPCK